MTIAPDMVLAENILLRNGVTREMIQHFDAVKMDNKNHQTPLMKNNEVVEFPADQTTLTKRYTEHSVDFINQQAGKSPFFLYLAHTMPHIPIFASKDFLGKSKGGLYGDVIEEVDWSVGEIMKALEKKYAGQEVPLPANWGGWRVAPETVEFWQGRRSRLHDRLRFRREKDGGWSVERLAP